MQTSTSRQRKRGCGEKLAGIVDTSTRGVKREKCTCEGTRQSAETAARQRHARVNFGPTWQTNGRDGEEFRRDRPFRPPGRPVGRRDSRAGGARRVSRTRAESSRRCTAAACGRCGSTPGFGTAAESNARYRYLLAQGVSGLSVAFDLPTQMGYDSDHRDGGGRGRPRRRRDRFDRGHGACCFDGIPLDRVSTSMTINSTAIILLALYVAVARRQGVPLATLSGTIQNDILKEYIARGTYIYPPRRSLRIVTDIFAWCERELPELEHDFDQRVPHPRSRLDGGAGGGVHARERHRLRRGRATRPASTSIASASACRSSSTRTTTSWRRSPSSAPRGGCGPASCAIASARRIRARCSCASTRRPPAARSPRSSRTTTSSAWRSRRWRPCSAARSRCTATAATRRWRCRPRTRRASRCARSRSSRPSPVSRTPWIRSGGAWAIEKRTAEIEQEARELIAKIDTLGGTLAAIESGWIQRQVQDAAYAAQQAIDCGDQVIVGVNRYPDRRTGRASSCFASIRQASGGRPTPCGRSARAAMPRRGARPWRRSKRAAADGTNLVPPVLAAVEARATLGEISDAMRRVFGEHRDQLALTLPCCASRDCGRSSRWPAAARPPPSTTCRSRSRAAKHSASSASPAAASPSRRCRSSAS